ncbi:MAG: hypothetical protein IKP50_03890 [Bacilli bacterium]|nr:hypothetical protein [Bacilli bacterium]
MKIFINTTSWAIVKQENEAPILVGNNYVDALKVYYNANPSTQYFYPTLNILKPNDRKVGLISFDATSVEEPNPSTYTDDDNNTWYMFKFTLSSDNHQIDVSGKYQFTITTNYYNSTNGAILKQRNINTILSVVNAVTNDDNSVLILGDDPSQVVAELYALCQSLQTGVASLQISVSALISNKADRDNTSQTIKAGLIKTHTLQGNGFGVLVDDEISFNDITWFTDGDGTNKWKIFYNSDGNLQFTSVTPAKKVEIANVKVNEIHDGTGTSEIEMTLGGIQFIAKKWDNPSLYRQLNFYYESGVEIDEPTRSFNPTTKNYVDTKDATLQTNINTEITNRTNADTALQTNINNEATARFNADNNLQSQIDGINAGQNLADIVADLTALNNLPTTNLKVEDKVQVLVDSDHDDGSTVYNWNGSSWRYIGKYGQDGYTKAEANTLLATKQDVIDDDNKVSSDYIDDTNQTHKFVSANEKAQIAQNANDITAMKDGTNIDSFADVETAISNITLSGDNTSVEINSKVISVKDKGITGNKLNLLSISNIKNLATNNCGNIHNDTAPAWLKLRIYNFNIEQGKTYLVCAMFKKNANHTDTAQVVSNLRYSGTTYSNYTTIAYQNITLSSDYQFVYRVFTANEDKSNYFGAYFYRYSAYNQEKVIDIDVKSMLVCELPNNYNYEEIMNVVKNYDYLANIDYLTNIQEIKNDFWDDKTILCYGDSLTMGAGGSGTTYPSELQTLLGNTYDVKNYGVGGEDALMIACRQGGIQAMLKPMNITTSYTNCEIKSIIGNTTLNSFGYQSGRGLNPVLVDGKECDLHFSSWTQQTIKSTTAFTTTRPLPVIPYSATLKNKTLIIWAGQNGWGSQDYEDLIKIIKNMIEYNQNNKYLVIGLSTGTTTSRADLENAMTHAFGNHYINIREYLVNYGLDDNNLTPTSQDETDISNGTVPTSLRNDGTHLNASGYSSVAKCVYQYGKNNGLW